MLRLAILLSVATTLFADQTAIAQEADPAAVVYLVRKPLSIRPADRFQVPIQLEPEQRLTISSTISGPVQAILSKLGDDVAAQAEIVRVDSEEQRLQVERAQAAVEAAEAAVDGPGKQEAVKVAKLDLQIAQLLLDRTKTVAPFAGQIIEIHVVPGQFIREATPLVTLIDQSKLTARIPVDRSETKVGDKLPVSVEGVPYDATVTAILPLEERYEPLRDLFASVATAVVEFDNGGTVLKAGQTVRSELIPRNPVAEVSNPSVSTDEAGSRRVFVIRNEVAVSVPVQVLGAVGESKTFVAGEFAAGDELVAEGSENLVDGRRVVPAAEAGVAAAPTAGGAGTTTTPAGQTKPKAGPGVPAATGGF